MKSFLVQAVPSSLGGPYRNITAIGGDGGGGHFSAVFEATHTATGDTVALKFFADQSNDSYRRDCFSREGELLSTVLRDEPLFVRLVEPPATFSLNVPVNGFGTLPLSWPYLAFEWLPHGNLEAMCTPTQGYLDLIDRLQLFWGACRSVARLHYLGCAHRDLKPGNFFLKTRRSVKLGDFGTARLVGPGVRPLLPIYGGIPGDRRYSSLESLAGIRSNDMSVLRRGDAYSLGAILFELVTGQPLYVHIFGGIKSVIQWEMKVRSIPEAGREDAFHRLLRPAPYSLPKLRTLNPSIPKCVEHHLTLALERLAHPDYRERIGNLSDIHRILEMCRIVLTHEARDRQIICSDPSKRRPDLYV